MELVRRYSNNTALLDDLRNARQAAMSTHVEDEPELGGDKRAYGRQRRVNALLTADGLREVVACYKSGMTARELAEKFSISQTSVKRILRQAGVRKRRKPPS